jgi:hypothetical protein
MDTSTEYARNSRLLKKCRKNYTVLVIIYFFSLIFFPLLTFFMMLASAGAPDTFMLIADSILVFPAAMYCAWQASYRRRDIFVIITAALIAVNQLILHVLQRYTKGVYLKYFTFHSVKYCAKIHLGVLIIILLACALNMYTNITYHKLEKADGFPNFSIIHFEQEKNSIQLGIKDPYRVIMEEKMKSASDTMADVTAVEGELEKYHRGHTPSGMDDV